jgi:hypothetical protein
MQNIMQTSQGIERDMSQHFPRKTQAQKVLSSMGSIRAHAEHKMKAQDLPYHSNFLKYPSIAKQRNL